MERAGHIATIVASLVAILTFGAGLWQFNQTQQLARKTLQQEREAKAVELFLKFNELQKEVAAKPLPRKGEAAFWHFNAMLGVTESVFKLTIGDPGWEETVSWMLETQEPFITQTIFNCNTFSPTFLMLMKKITPKIRCINQ